MVGAFVGGGIAGLIGAYILVVPAGMIGGLIGRGIDWLREPSPPNAKKVGQAATAQPPVFYWADEPADNADIWLGVVVCLIIFAAIAVSTIAAF